jgi:adhesin/invasin
MRTGISRLASTAGALALGLSALLVTGCDKVPLTAPGNSTLTLTTGTAASGNPQVTATVLEQAGTPVQNGTTVRFSTTMGRMDPTEAQTRNGMASSVFVPDGTSGEATITVSSGTATATTTFRVGAAAVETVTLRANPASVPASGGTVELIATVVGTGGGGIGGIPVTFSTNEGTLTANRVTTDANGEARTSLSVTLATGGTASVTATAGTKTSSAVTITRQAPTPSPTVTVAATGETATTIGQRWTFTATVAGTNDTTLPVQFEWDFGDGTSASTSGPSTAHVYGSDSENKVRTVALTVRLANGNSINTVTQIIIADFP